MKRTLLIYGFDGLDPDVTINLRYFFERLGFAVMASTRLLPADVICVERTPTGRLDLSSYRAVHVFDYVGAQNLEFMTSLIEVERAYIYFPSSKKMENSLNQVPQLATFSRVMLPPVATEMWIHQGKSRVRDGVVHIGNFKPFLLSKQDEIAASFLQILSESKVSTWGNRWPAQLQIWKYKGRAKLLSTSKIYAKAQAALGIMYPFQRELTISGRFWQSPLNGTPLYSEAIGEFSSIPGLYLWPENLSTKAILDLSEKVDKDALKVAAREFWDRHFHDCLNVIGATSGPSTRVISLSAVRLNTIQKCVMLWNVLVGLKHKFRIR